MRKRSDPNAPVDITPFVEARPPADLFADRQMRTLCEAVGEIMDKHICALRAEFNTQFKEHEERWHAEEYRALAEINEIVERLKPAVLEETS